MNSVAAWGWGLLVLMLAITPLGGCARETPASKDARAAATAPASKPVESTGTAGATVASTQTPATVGIEPLTVRGQDFVDRSGRPVRFWGMNLVALYPTPETSEKLAANLASLQVNLVRPHHMLRPGKDWNPDMVSGALMTYLNDSRTPDPVAWDRFDALSAALRNHGVYLALAIDWSRRYLPGDVDILKTSDDDRTAWMAAMKELNGWHWQKQRDVVKMLPVIDERAALVQEEFATMLLTRVNPHTGRSYASDPQVLTLEVLNEASTEYAIICQNKFPEYWQTKLLAKWSEFARQNNVEPGDLYAPKTPVQKQVRAAFLRKLDEDYFRRMEKVVRGTGCKASMIFSNLWRGDNAAKWQAEVAGHVEDHQYCDPLIARDAADGWYAKSQTLVASKPYFLGELNISEDAGKMAERAPYRTMLPLAASAYGAFNDWSGVVWFAWIHGGRSLGADGWSTGESRAVSVGDMIGDGMVMDHLRTSGMIFRRGLVAPSNAPVTWYVEDPLWAADYGGLMRGKSAFNAGWHEIHAIRKAYGPAPAEQAKAKWMADDSGDVLLSDTREILKDMKRRQLTVAAPRVEAFSGFLDHQPPQGPVHLHLSGTNGDFATVIAVVDAGSDRANATRLVISRTGLSAEKKEIDGPEVSLSGLRARSPGSTAGSWYMRITRPRAAPPTARSHTGADWQSVKTTAAGELTLPAGWHEIELEWR